MVAGTKAKFKGSGTINGEGDYKFMLTAIDGDPDMFRIKITEGDNVVYDNKRGASDEGDDATAIGGGSIVIHNAKVKKPLPEVAAGPAEFALYNNSPNPFNPVTTLQYAIPAGKSGYVRLNVYDLRGALVRKLVDQVKEPGIHTVVLNGTDESGNKVSSGVYIFQIHAGEFRKSNKMLLVK